MNYRNSLKGDFDYMNKDLLQEIGTELKNNTKATLLEALINCFIQDPVDFGKNIIEILHQTKSIPDMILWNNFYLFLQEGNFEYDVLRKLAAKLEESGDKKENATSIVYTVNRIDDPRKAKYISWLTLSVINNDMDFDKYFRLVKTIENLVYADLIYLSKNVENVIIDSSDSHVDDFLANGMIYTIDGGFAYTDKAYDLVEYAIRRGHSVRRPKKKPERQIFDFEIATDEDIDQIISGA